MTDIVDKHFPSFSKGRSFVLALASKIQAVVDSHSPTLALPEYVVLAAKLELCQKLGGNNPNVKDAFERANHVMQKRLGTIFDSQMNGIWQLPEKVKAQEMQSLDHELLQAFKKSAGQIVESKSHLDGCQNAAPEICNLMEMWQQRLQKDLKHVFDQLQEESQKFLMTIIELDSTGDWSSSEPCQHISASLHGWRDSDRS